MIVPSRSNAVPSALAKADSVRFKQVIGDGLHSFADGRRATEVSIAVRALDRMLELGRPEYVRNM
ncbi:hypothetical protein [Muricoccus aerilatus]|uniref:hypothetical protein n=1 Tax=Muricoccus aerilatus TaxID=452982 RepID=UPI000B0D2778|nr:hypothetical protein [Roseomonas aerilata]